jgi:hypothetical protein
MVKLKSLIKKREQGVGFSGKDEDPKEREADSQEKTKERKLVREF